MKNIKQEPKDEKIIDILKRVAKRVEEATVDIHSMKSDLKFVNLRLGQVERNTEIMKIDMEKMKREIVGIKEEMVGMKTDIATMKKDIKGIIRNTEDMMETDAEILAKMVTQEELTSLSQRVSSLEHH